MKSNRRCKKVRKRHARFLTRLAKEVKSHALSGKNRAQRGARNWWLDTKIK